MRGTIVVTVVGLIAALFLILQYQNCAPSGGTSPFAFTSGSTNAPSLYQQTIVADHPMYYWRLGDSTRNVFNELMAHNTFFGTGSLAQGTPGAILNDPDFAVNFGGGYLASSMQTQGPTVFSLELWFNIAQGSTGGLLIGFGNNNSGLSSTYDRHVYIATNGQLFFGVFLNAAITINSQFSYLDGRWHHMVATFSSGNDNLFLYIDGAQVATLVSTGTIAAYSGYWRVANDNLANWPGAPTDPTFRGIIDEVAVYNTVLTPQQVANHYSKGSTGQ